MGTPPLFAGWDGGLSAQGWNPCAFLLSNSYATEYPHMKGASGHCQ